jgi:rare lipoprotein A
MGSGRTSIIGLLTCAGLVACGAEEGPRTEGEAARGAEMATLPPAVVENLKQQYPVLREEAAPEPQPNGAARPDEVPDRVRSALPDDVLETVRGEATFYSNIFEGRRTASGIPFRQNQMVAAHPAYPFGTLLRVTNTRNNESVNVRVVDRGPFGARAQARGTIIDLSRRAAERLDFITAGRAPVRVEVLEWGEGLPAAVS